MPLPGTPQTQNAPAKDYRIRPLKRGDKDAVFRLLAADGKRHEEKLQIEPGKTSRMVRELPR